MNSLNTDEYKKILDFYKKGVENSVDLNKLDFQLEKYIRSFFIKRKKVSTVKKPKVNIFFSFALIFFGLYILYTTLFPIVLYFFKKTNLYSPLTRKDTIVKANAKNFNIENSEEKNQIVKFVDVFFYTDINSDIKVQHQDVKDDEVYYLDIPKLKIYDAKVIKGDEKYLSQSLVQYPGSPMPGEKGFTIIFGHSALRKYYNPDKKNKNRYKVIFSTIMTLDNGDKIFIKRNGIKYTYIVVDKIEVNPDDVYILNQDYNTIGLKLVTCTPEGTLLRRGVVIAQLVNSN